MHTNLLVHAALDIGVAINEFASIVSMVGANEEETADDVAFLRVAQWPGNQVTIAVLFNVLEVSGQLLVASAGTVIGIVGDDKKRAAVDWVNGGCCLLYTSPSPRD